VQRCGLLRQLSVCLSVEHNCEPTKTDGPIEMLFGYGTQVYPGNRLLSGGGGPDPQGKGNFEGCSRMKCIRLHKQQIPQQHGAADLSAGDRSSRRKRGFRMDSPAAGLTSAGAMRPFVEILWPLIVIITIIVIIRIND